MADSYLNTEKYLKTLFSLPFVLFNKIEFKAFFCVSCMKEIFKIVVTKRKQNKKCSHNFIILS